MLSDKLHSLAAQLLLRPTLAPKVSSHLTELAECVAAMEQASISPAILAAGVHPLPPNVVLFPGRSART